MELDVLDQVLRSKEVDSFLRYLDKESRAFCEAVAKELQQHGTSDALEALWRTDYERKPIDALTFLTSHDYLGEWGDTMHDLWMDDMLYVLDPMNLIIEHLLVGAIGTGKTVTSVLEQLYKLYRLSCLKEPATFYGLGPRDKISIGVFNITLDHSEDGSDKIRRIIDESPYFKEVFPRDVELKRDIVFPQKNLRIDVGSLEEHELGWHLFGMMMDEANFYKGGASEQGRAHKLYMQTRIRMVSRYMVRGRVPGLFNVISSSNARTDWTDLHIKQVRNQPDTYISHYAMWQVKPSSSYSGRTFNVFVGDERFEAKILAEREVSPRSDGKGVLAVPVEYKSLFETDVHSSLRNIAGVSTVGLNPLLNQVDALYACIDRTRVSPFTKDPVICGVRSGQPIINFIDKAKLLTIKPSGSKVKYHPDRRRRIHVDVGVTGDALGFCMGCNIGRDQPHIFIDLMVRVRAEPSDQVDLDGVRQFIEDLRSLGYPITDVTADGYEHFYLLQMLEKAGFKTKVFSVDKVDTPYLTAIGVLSNHRASYYEYPKFITEMRDLERDVKRHKVNHPQQASDGEIGSKDVSDAFTAVCAQLVQDAGATGGAQADKMAEEAQKLAPLLVGAAEGSLHLLDGYKL